MENMKSLQIDKNQFTLLAQNVSSFIANKP